MRGDLKSSQNGAKIIIVQCIQLSSPNPPISNMSRVNNHFFTIPEAEFPSGESHHEQGNSVDPQWTCDAVL